MFAVYSILTESNFLQVKQILHGEAISVRELLDVDTFACCISESNYLELWIDFADLF